MAMRLRFSEFSFNRDESEEEIATYEAHTSVHQEGGTLIYRIHSKTMPAYVHDVVATDDPVATEEEKQRQQRFMYLFDEERRRRRGIPKGEPESLEPGVCPACGGNCEVEDKLGNWRECRTCGGTGYVGAEERD